jgi:hypothetical protein
VTTTPADPATETPQRALKVAGAAVVANIVVMILGLVVGGGLFLLAEALLGLVVVVTSMVQYRRGSRYTGVGLLGGWIGGMLIAAVVLAVT